MSCFIFVYAILSLAFILRNFMGDWGAGNWGDWGDWGAGNCRKGLWSLRVKWEKKKFGEI